jgi:competence protein ComFC
MIPGSLLIFILRKKKMGQLLPDLFAHLLPLFYPFACHICGSLVESQKDLPCCSICWSTAELFTEEDSVLESKVKVFSAGKYKGALRSALLWLKREPYIGKRLGRIIRDSSQKAIVNCDRIIPVPLHKERRKERGYNQASLIAATINRKVPVDDQSLSRIYNTEVHRAGMDSLSRKQSLEGVFEVQRAKVISGERILLVDDLWTTGATALGCAETLLSAGASDVRVFTLCRGVMADR